MLSNLKMALATILTITSFIFSQDVMLSIDGTSLNYESSADIYGFQFNHNGCALSASGGAAIDAGFTISASSSVVLAFSFSGGFIPSGSGTLIDLGGECETLSGFVFSGQGGASLSADLSGNDGGDGGDDGSTADHIVELLDMSFSPENLNIETGETVEWVWVSGFHNVNGSQESFPDNPESFESELGSDLTFSHTFNIAGHYD